MSDKTLASDIPSIPSMTLPQSFSLKLPKKQAWAQSAQDMHRSIWKACFENVAIPRASRATAGKAGVMDSISQLHILRPTRSRDGEDARNLDYLACTGETRTTRYMYMYMYIPRHKGRYAVRELSVEINPNDVKARDTGQNVVHGALLNSVLFCAGIAE